MVLNFTAPMYTLLFLYSEIYIVHVIYYEWSRSINFSVVYVLYAIQTYIFPTITTLHAFATNWQEVWEWIHVPSLYEFYYLYFGSVWIGLILLKLKTYCWNHCSKTIFKCVNSIVRPIFNEKIDKKWNLWVRELYTDALFTGKSQHLRLLFMHCSLNSSRTPLKTRENKKKKKKGTKRTKRSIS